jgi:hypothetical protein
MKPSERYDLNKDDLKKILIGAGVAMAGALLTYAAETVGQVDFGDMTPYVVAFTSIAINVARKVLAGR